MTQHEKLEDELGTPADDADIHESSSHLGYRDSAIVTVSSVDDEPLIAADDCVAVEHPSESDASAAGLKAAPLRSAPPPRRKAGSTTWLMLAGVVALGGAVMVARNANEPEVRDAKPPALTGKPSKVALEQPAAVVPAPAAPVPTTPAPTEPVAAEPIVDAPPEATRAAATPHLAAADKPKKPASADTSATAKTTSDPFEGDVRPAADVEDKPPAVVEPTPPATPAAPPPVAEAEKKPVSDDRKYSTECLLDPNAPGCKDKKDDRAPQDPFGGGMSGSLPDKLSQTQIRDGVTPRKAAAKACGEKFGATAGTLVRVKLSIEGATGKVLVAEPLAPHDQQPVGKCVAEALAGAAFPKFKTQQQGTTYPVKL